MFGLRRGWVSAALTAAVGVANAQNAAFVNSPRLQVPTVPREMRAAWVATVYQIDWPGTRGSSASTVTTQRSQMNTILNNLKDANMNAVFLQVRSQGDAMYPSALEPWSYYLTNRQGQAPASGYDPLQEWIAGAKQRGMMLFAWFNPYRALVNTPTFNPPPGTGWNDSNPPTGSGYVAPLHRYRAQSSSIRLFNNVYWLDPGDPAARAHSKAVIMDVVRRYDIDGVVFDDYFYPYPATGQTFGDSGTYALYGGGLSLSNWRRKNVNDFIFDIYNSINNEPGKENTLFGIGPFGIWRPGNPPGIVGLDSYADIYADSKLWWNNGWVDFLAPQLYWKISSTGQPYIPLLTWWSQQNLQNRHLWPSNYTSQIATTASTSSWEPSEIISQISETRNVPGASGNVHYSAKPIRDNHQSLRTLMRTGVYSVPALPPATTWKDAVPPLRPNVSLSQSGANHVIAWTPNGAEPIRWWAVSLLIGSSWQHQVLSGTSTSVSVPRSGGSGPVRAFSISAVDRLGNASPGASRVLDPTVLSPSFRPD